MRRSLKFTLLVAVIGYMGAASFYAYLPGLNVQHQWACPVCLHILSVGQTPTQEFIYRTIGFGTMNGALFVAAGWLIAAAYRGLRRLSSSPH
jgi:hypothetical protein